MSSDCLLPAERRAFLTRSLGADVARSARLKRQDVSAPGLPLAVLLTCAAAGCVPDASAGRWWQIWDVSNEALRHSDVSGLWKLAILTSMVRALPRTASSRSGRASS